MSYSDKDVDAKVAKARQFLFDAQVPHNLTTEDFVKKLATAKAYLDDALRQANAQLRLERRQAHKQVQHHGPSSSTHPLNCKECGKKLAGKEERRMSVCSSCAGVYIDKQF